tara:strand:- start:3064 stop:3420 length:357 start_codon:yes stop_codon:yes gene_type:complete
MVERDKVGEWSFIIGVLVSIVIGLFSSNLTVDVQGWLALLLVLLGLIVGFLNVSEKETTAFLIAAAALIITGTVDNTLNLIPTVGTYLVGVVGQVAVFVAPAALVVALKAIYNLASRV